MSVSSKSTLAKLLATENLRVEHQKVPTAMFDLKNRTLILPIWKDMSIDLYDLLIGHEVGHALYTPAQGWHGEIDSRGIGIKSFLNVLEDARIERKIKDKFPGIRRNFFAGYQELFDKDFFGVKDRDLSKLRLIDRINLHYKVGPFLNVQFSDDEQQYIARVDALETWDDVATLAVELYELAKFEPEPEFDLDDMMDALSGGIGDDDFDQGETFAVKDSAPSDESEGQQSDEKSDDAAEGEEEKETSSASAGEKESDDAADSAPVTEGVKKQGSNDVPAEPTYNEDPSSITDLNFREMEDTFIDAASRPYSYGVLRKVNVKDYVVPMDWVVDNMRPTVYSDRWNTRELEYNSVASELFTKFRNKNQKYINLMVQEFEMRRRAAQLSRAATAKTGRLDVDRVWAHKISEDLFARNTVVPDGKNHGMLLFLDMSGSMNMNMKGTIEQLVTLMMFCRKVRIPFEVYGFINNHIVRDLYPAGLRMVDNRRTHSGPKELSVGDNSFFLLQFVSNNCSAGKFNEAVRNLLAVSEAYDGRRGNHRGKELAYRLPDFMHLASTPLEESIVVARTIADEFRAKNRVEVLSTVFLTDGDGDDNIAIAGSKYSARHINLTDVATNVSATVKYSDDSRNQMQHALLEVYKKATGSRTINFFITGTHNAKWIAKRMYNHDVNFYEKWKNEWKQKYFHATNSSGFDDRFLIPGGNDLKIDEDILDTDATDARELRKAFMKFQNTKQTNRVLLTKMIQAVA
jgi:hypothetical protein